MRIHLNDGWSFSLNEPDDFSPVQLPHDWLISDPQNWYTSSVGWYRRTLDAGFLKAGRRVFLRFDGVYMNSTLLVNGSKAGEWKYGFTAFEHEITSFLTPDADNVLLMKVDARFPSSRWYTGAGINRNVELIIKNPCHFKSDGIKITARLEEDEWTYEAAAEVESGGSAYETRHALLEPGAFVPWSLEQPRLYTLRSELLVGGQVTDTAETRFGFRVLSYSPTDGFSINGRKMKLNGVCLHQEFAVAGSAVHPDYIRRQFETLKHMGVNAIRTAHNPPSSVFMDLADEMGMLVVSEFSDVWQLPKTAHDYARYFDAWHEKDVASWIRRDRNRPSVILWSLGNEIPDTHADFEKGNEVMAALRLLAARHDPGGQALPTLGSNYMAWENTQRCAQQLTAVGYNYAEFLYQKHHRQYPDWVIYGSETCSTVQSRGIYHFPLKQPVLSDDDLQCSSLGNSTTSWGARSVDDCIKDDRDTPFSIGQFVWSGQDYLGEPTPYHTKNSYFGMLDTAGFEKDAFYLFQAAWTDGQAAPMVYLYPYWDFSAGQLIDVRAATNQASVALFLNDQPLGRQDMDGEINRNWQVPYQPGRLRAEAYDEHGILTAQDEKISFSEAVQLHLSSQHLNSLTFVTISALDRDGVPVENANRLVRVSVSGGELLGLDNGDSTDYTPYQNNARRMFSGKLLAVIKRFPQQEPDVQAEFCRDGIPVRKIELMKDGFHVKAKILPEDAAPAQLHWRLTNAAGVDSNIAAFKPDEDGFGLTVIPQGDGAVYVRCGVMNGKSHIDLYSQIMYELSGFGQAALNPYQLVSAGLYTYSNVELTNGNERGVATLRDGQSWVCFENLDFGGAGADEMSIWLFPLIQDPFDFEVWDSRPDLGGRLLAKPLYNLGMVWNTYQEVRFRLSHPLKGKASLCFVFHMKSHIKGFLFHQESRAYEVISAGDCQELYGDGFRRDGGMVLEIGNNTTLGYTDLDFAAPGPDRLELTFRSGNEKNPVQVQFDGPDGQKRTMINVPKAEEFKSMIFLLDCTVSGSTSVRLVFLPGCKVDLASLRFLKAGPS